MGINKTNSLKEKKIFSQRGNIFVSAILIIILGFIAYGNSLHGEFIFDDYYLIKDNLYIRNWFNILQIFTENIEAGVGRETHFYRPIQMVTYMVDYSIWRFDVRGYHFTNILLHILVSLSIYWLINILYGHKLLSLFTSLLFIVHPIHTEAVTYISGRADSLVALFVLLCIIAYIKYLQLRSKSIYVFALLSYIFALLSRENALILPVLLFLYYCAFNKKFEIKSFFPIFIITVVYMLLRLTVLVPVLYHVSLGASFLQRIPGFLAAITNYIRLLLLPFNLHMVYDVVLLDFTNPKAIIGLLILSLLLIYAFSKRLSNKLAFFSICWFFVSLLPQSNIYPINAYMAEHWLYIPSIGFFLILSKGLSNTCRLRKIRALIILLFVSLLTSYCILTIRQNYYWREPEIFYKRNLRFAPNNSNLYNNLGIYYVTLRRYDEAIDLYKKAITINPNSAFAYCNLGKAYGLIGRSEDAIKALQKSIELNPTLITAYNSLSVLYYNMGLKKEAKVLFEKSIELNPINAEAHKNLALIYFYEKQYDLAIKHSEKAIQLGYVFSPEFLSNLESYRK